MPAHQYSVAPGGDKVAVTDTATLTAVSGGATSLGGTHGSRVLVDTAVVTSKAEFLRELDIIRQRIAEGTWPPA